MNKTGKAKVKCHWLIPDSTRRKIDLMAAMERKRASHKVTELIDAAFDETMAGLNHLDTIDGFDQLSDVDKEVEQRR